jgi:hypothetical protein
VLAAGLLLFCFPVQAHVTHNQDKKTIVTQWVWLDYISRTTEQGSFQGQLRLPASRHLWLENTLGAQVILTVEGQEVYRGDTSAEIVLDDAPDVVEFVLSYTWQTFPPRGQLGLMQAGLLGTKHIIPPWQYVQANSGDGLRDLLRSVFYALPIIAVVIAISSLRLSSRAWVGLGLIFGLSLFIHLLILSQKFNNPGTWTMETAWDNYVTMGRNWLAGYRPIAGDEFQQGNYLYMGMLQLVCGPELGFLYIFNAIVGSFGAVFVTLAGWALFDRPTGYVAGIGMSLFAPIIHYQLTLQTDALVVFWICMLIALVSAFYRWPSLLLAALCGFVVGVSTVFRGTNIVMLLWPLGIILLLKTSWREYLGYSGLIIVFAILPILPITITNFNGGYWMLSPSRGDIQMLRANNRDADGLNAYMTQSERLARVRGGENWTRSFQEDLTENPSRLFQLTIRRLALYFDATEHSDFGMLNYRTTGLNVSPTLRLLSLGENNNFRILMLLGVVGVIFGLTNLQTRQATLIIGIGTLIYVASLALFYTVGRVRIPTAPYALLLAASALISLWRMRTRSRRFGVMIGITVAIMVVLTVVSAAIIDYFPRPRLLSADQLPASLTPVQGTFAGEIKLLGYGFYETTSQPGGYLTFDLYWQTLRSVTDDYVMTVRLVNTVSHTVDYVYNFDLGAQSTPLYPSTRWQVGDIFQERYLVELPNIERSEPRAYDLLVGLYIPETETLASLTESTVDSQDNHLRLTGVGLEDNADIVAAPQASLIVWDDRLVMESWECRMEGETVTLAADWWLKQRATQPQHMFVHLLDGDTVIAQQDAPPVANRPLDAWIPHTRQQTRWQFEGVSTPVTVRLGFYNPYTLVRWPITANGGILVQDNYVLFDCEDS